MNFFLVWIFPALLLGAVAILLLLSTHRHIQRCKAVSTWQKAPGTVTASGVERHARRRRVIGMRASYQSSHYVAKIEYSYNVMGSLFISDQLQNFAGDYLGTRQEDAASLAADYPVGKEVTVFYDPNNPADACLLPQTSTQKLMKRRTGQLILLALAMVWGVVGVIINLSTLISGNLSDARIKSSAGLLPQSAQDITAKLDPLVEKYQLVCSQESTAGNTLVYAIQACRASDAAPLTSFEVYSRKESPETVDLVSAIFTPSDVQNTITFFNEAVSLVFEGDDLQSAQAWIAEKVSKVTSSEGSAVATIGGVDLALNDLGGTLRLNFGDLQ